MALQLRGSRVNFISKLTGVFIAVFALFIQPVVALDIPAAFAQPVINEVMPKPVSVVGAEGEWIELLNQGDEISDISGWNISDGDISKKHIFAASTTLSPGQHFVVCAKASVEGVTCNDTWLNMSLKDTGDTVILSDGAVDVDSFEYQSSDVTAGDSIEVVREDNDKKAAPNNNPSDIYDSNAQTGTPNKINSTVASGGVKNEDSGETFTTIQAAINDDQTNDGDTIKVAAKAGGYNEDVRVNKSINLISEDNATINGQGGQYAVELKGSLNGVKLSGFTVNGSDGQEALKIEQSSPSKNITITNNKLVSGNGGHAVYAGMMTDSAFLGNTFSSLDGKEPAILVYLMGSNNNVDFTGNTFTGNIGNHLAFSTTASNSEFSGNNLSAITAVGKDKLVEIKGTTDATADGNIYPINPGIGWAAVNPASANFKGVYRLQKSVDTAVSSDTVKLLSNIKLDSDVDITTDNITINGDEYSIDAAFDKPAGVNGNSNNSALSVEANNVNIKNLIVDGANGINLHGINIYEANNVNVDKVTAKNFRSGIVVNSSSALVNDFTTSGNSWNAIDLDQNTSQAASLKVTGRSTHSESISFGIPGFLAHVYVEDKNKDITFEDVQNQYVLKSYNNTNAYVLRDQNSQNQLNVSGVLYRDNKLNDCDNKTECESRSSDRLKDWKVQLYKEDVNQDWQEVKSVQTNSDGIYNFGAQQDAGTYHVCFVQQDGWVQSKQTWTGSGYRVATDAPQSLKDSDGVAPFCATTVYDDTKDRSWKQNIGNVDTQSPAGEIILDTAYNPTKLSFKATDNYSVNGYAMTVWDQDGKKIATNKGNYGLNAGNLNEGKTFEKDMTDQMVVPATYGSPKVDITKLTDGVYTVKLSLYDTAKNQKNGITDTFTVDHTNPTITVKNDYVGDKTETAKVFSQVSFKLYDKYKIDYYTINEVKKELGNGVWSDANFQNFKSELNQGSNNTIVLYDVAGNESSYSFTYDSVAPKVMYVNRTGTPELTSNDSVKFLVKFTEDMPSIGVSNFELVGSADGEITGFEKDSSYPDRYYLTVTNITGDGMLKLQVKSDTTDEAGNQIEGRTSFQSYTIDNTAPSADTVMLNGSNITSSTTEMNCVIPAEFYAVNDTIGFNANFSDSLSGVEKVQYRVQEILSNGCSKTSTLSLGYVGMQQDNGTWKGTFDTTGITDETKKYSVHIVAEDNVGNRSERNIGFIVDNTSPANTYAGEDQTVEGNKATLSGSADDATIFEWSKLSGPDGEVSFSDNGSSPVSDVNVAEFGTYIFKFVARDNIGNVSDDTVQVVFEQPEGGSGANPTPELTPEPVTPNVDQPVTSSTSTTGLISPLSQLAFTQGITGAIGSATTGSALVAATTERESDDDDSGDVLGTNSPSTDGSVKNAAAAQSPEGWKLFGIAWYWIFLLLAALAGLWWFLVARRNAAEDANL